MPPRLASPRLLDTKTLMFNLTDASLAHTGLRLILGVNIALHGLTRLPELGAFAEKIAGLFSDTILPHWLVSITAHGIPIAEALIGLAVLIGFRLRWSLFAGLCLIGLLTFGTCMRQAWETAGAQLVYGIAFWILLFRHQDAALSWDAWRIARSGGRQA